jgi:hypothetical protein
VEYSINFEDAYFGFGCNILTAVEKRFETPETVGCLLEAGRHLFIEAWLR